MFISKKDLLVQTGISYGQLYRWKREGLIPEDWFVKQPSFTGQETFFPKSKILNRIKAIQELKDKYSLEELSKILSPEVSSRHFTTDDLQAIDEVDNSLIPCFKKSFAKDSFSFIEVLFLIAVCTCKKKYSFSLSQVESLCIGVKDNLKDITQTEYLLVLLNKDNEYLFMIKSENADVFIDKRLIPVYSIRLSDISAMMKLKYRKSFNFRFDEEETSSFNFSNEGMVTI